MDKNAKIYVAGHRGLVGSALMRKLYADGYDNIITRTHAELDLIDQTAVADFFSTEKPDYVFLAAAKVGGIHANNTYPAEFLYENLAIQTNIIHHAYLCGVKKLLFLGSSCIYPRDCLQPIKEEYLLTGLLEPTNRPYALAKISGIEMCWSYNRQYGTQYLCVMPTNLYGIGDNYHPENGHVLPALIHKFHGAKINNQLYIKAWGTGTPKREFLYSDDMADACLFLMNLAEDKINSLFNAVHPPLVNIGCGEDLTIKELAHLIKEIIGFEGAIEFDTSKPDGTFRKQLDVSRINQLGWKATTSLREGIMASYCDYISSISIS